jgi:hypothetical protein
MSWCWHKDLKKWPQWSKEVLWLEGLRICSNMLIGNVKDSGWMMVLKGWRSILLETILDWPYYQSSPPFHHLLSIPHFCRSLTKLNSWPSFCVSAESVTCQSVACTTSWRVGDSAFSGITTLATHTIFGEWWFDLQWWVYQGCVPQTDSSQSCWYHWFAKKVPTSFHLPHGHTVHQDWVCYHAF